MSMISSNTGSSDDNETVRKNYVVNYAKLDIGKLSMLQPFRQVEKSGSQVLST